MIFPTDLVEFTDEEGYGRYLDLHDCYLKYINLKSSEVSGCYVWDQGFPGPAQAGAFLF